MYLYLYGTWRCITATTRPHPGHCPATSACPSTQRCTVPANYADVSSLSKLLYAYFLQCLLHMLTEVVEEEEEEEEKEDDEEEEDEEEKEEGRRGRRKRGR